MAYGSTRIRKFANEREDEIFTQDLQEGKEFV
jgi:hypothetical protein